MDVNRNILTPVKLLASQGTYTLRFTSISTCGAAYFRRTYHANL